MSTRGRLFKFWLVKSLATPALHKFISEIILSTPQALTQFILDPCQSSPIQELWNTLGQDMINHVFYLTRTFAYYMHRAKMISLGRWPGDPGRKPKLISKNKILPPAHLTVVVSDPIINYSVTGSPMAMACHPTTTSTTPLTTVARLSSSAHLTPVL